MKLVFTLLLVVISNIGFAQNTVAINGHAESLKDGTILTLTPYYPSRFSRQTNVPINLIVKEGKFSTVIKSDGGEGYFLENNKNISRIFLGPGKATITIQDTALKNVIITDNITSTENDLYINEIKDDKIVKEYFAAKKDFYSSPKDTDTTLMNRKMNKYDSLKTLYEEESLNVNLNWIKNHPHSFTNCHVLYDLLSFYHAPEAEVKKQFQLMSAEIKNDSWGRELQYFTDSLFIGGKAPEFVQADTNGKKVKLSDFRGKYILLDFWASWCMPCRADNPNQVKAMKKFKNRNFTIVGISLDNKKDSWLRAINHDKLFWTQLSDLKDWGNEVSVKYYVYSIPNNFLIDPDGRIVAKNLHGNELLEMLDKLIK